MIVHVFVLVLVVILWPILARTVAELCVGAEVAVVVAVAAAAAVVAVSPLELRRRLLMVIIVVVVEVILAVGGTKASSLGTYLYEVHIRWGKGFPNKQTKIRDVS